MPATVLNQSCCCNRPSLSSKQNTRDNKMKALDETQIPVIAAIGEVCHRPSDPAKGREPVDLIAEALQLANNETRQQALDHLDSIHLVGQVTWPYTNPVDAICQRLGIHPKEAHNASMGGDTPIRLLHEAALRITRGSHRVCAIVGGESVNAKRKASAAKVALNWTPKASPKETVIVEGQDFPVHPAVKALGIKSPVHTYPLYEMALQAALKQTPEQGNKESAQLWHSLACVAADNPYAWIKEPPSEEHINTVTDSNPLIAYPYPKLMVANSSVNQASAIIVTDLAWAKAAGLKEEQLIYIWGGASAAEADDFLDRDDYSRSHAQLAVLDAAVEQVGGDPKAIDYAELYSCFPVVPKLALQHLKLRADVKPTVTGGLTFFGGPLNNYMSHSVCAMTRKLRGKANATGLLYANGGLLTKHHALIVSSQPASESLPKSYSVQAEVERRSSPAPVFNADYNGPASIETYTVLYDKAGLSHGFIVARTPDNARTVAKVRADDTHSINLLLNLSASAVGEQGVIRTDAFGECIWSTAPKKRSQSPSFCTITKDQHITTITINRPEVMNALHPMANEELAEAFNDFEQDNDQWVAILTGAGTRAFCSGNDLKFTAQTQRHGRKMQTPVSGYGGVTARWTLNKPVIAAVNGIAMGGGFEIALSCDLIIASDKAVFALPEPQVGLAAVAGGLLRLPQQIGLKKAMGMILTGERVSAQDGERLGFVNAVVEPSQLMSSARDWAKRIIACSPLAIRASKAIATQGMNTASLPEAYRKQHQLPAVREMYRSEDLREGPKAFAEKRPPKWQGK